LPIDVWLTKKSSNCPICKYDCRETLQEKGLLVAEESVGTTTPSAVRDLSIPTDTATEVHIEMEPVSHSNQRDNPATANNNAH